MSKSNFLSSQIHTILKELNNYSILPNLLVFGLPAHCSFQHNILYYIIVYLFSKPYLNIKGFCIEKYSFVYYLS